jgi:hypothetical protein
MRRLLHLRLCLYILVIYIPVPGGAANACASSCAFAYSHVNFRDLGSAGGLLGGGGGLGGGAGGGKQGGGKQEMLASKGCGHPRTLRSSTNSNCLQGMLHQMHAPRWGTLSGGVAVGGDDGRRRYWGRVEQGIQG